MTNLVLFIIWLLSQVVHSVVNFSTSDGPMNNITNAAHHYDSTAHGKHLAVACPCSAGFYCSSNICTSCSAGSFCPGNDLMYQCPEGEICKLFYNCEPDINNIGRASSAGSSSCT